MKSGMQAGGEHVPIQVLLQRAIHGLERVDAEALEALLASVERLQAAGRLALPRSAPEWEQSRSLQWIFAHLLGSTGQRLTLLRRLGQPVAEFRSYSGPEHSLSELSYSIGLPRAEKNRHTIPPARP